ncbi:DNA-processing protein DprA [Massilia sp. R2A-15]|uniref:DNA-processing protein DprA n=1 Tax=Massilia sp. R2A-15 TaxID=3064278 RepID=UPI0035A662EF
MQDTDLRPPIDAAALAAWMRLEQTPGVGAATIRRLIDEFGSPQAILDAAPRKWPAPSAEHHREVERALDWLGHPGHHLITLTDPDYPALLLQIPDPPPLLFVAGRVHLLAAPALAIVGSRNATLQGKANAEVFAQALSCAGLTIVSGLALGIDAAAHTGGLNGAGSTIAVIGTGPDIAYPARNRALWQRIAAEGCVVSEHPPGTPPLPHHFPRRNRIISGLSEGVLVVEAAAQSGSLITAHLAAEQGRDVFAIPGSIHSSLAKGCHKLIKEGAKLVESAADVLGELRRMQVAAAPAPAASHPLLDAMGHDPIGQDALARLAGCAPADLSLVLLELELAGQVERLPGGLVQRLVR